VTAYWILGLLHRYLGLTTAVFLAIAGLTGSVIAFHTELDAWLNPNLFYAKGGEALSPSALVDRVEASDPRIRVAFVEVNPKPGRSATLFVEPKDESEHELTPIGYNQVFADPATGEVLGHRRYGGCCLQREAIIPFLYNLHRRLTLPSHWGDWLMGGIAILWLIDCFVALMISIPRRVLNLRRWKTVLSVRGGGSAYRVTFDLHRASGLWLWVALGILAISSIYLNLGDAVVKPLVSLVSPLAPSPYERPAAAADDRSKVRSFDQILGLSESQSEKLGRGYRVTGIYFDREKAIYVTDFDTDDAVKLGSAWAAFDGATGALIGMQIPGQGSFGDIFLQLQLPLHSGRIGGLPGRIAICLLGILIAALSITGIAIWQRKSRARYRLKASRGADKDYISRAATTHR